jgi:hypothetical protein
MATLESVLMSISESELEVSDECTFLNVLHLGAIVYVARQMARSQGWEAVHCHQ